MSLTKHLWGINSSLNTGAWHLLLEPNDIAYPLRPWALILTARPHSRISGPRNDALEEWLGASCCTDQVAESLRRSHSFSVIVSGKWPPSLRPSVLPGTEPFKKLLSIFCRSSLCSDDLIGFQSAGIASFFSPAITVSFPWPGYTVVGDYSVFPMVRLLQI